MAEPPTDQPSLPTPEPPVPQGPCPNGVCDTPPPELGGAPQPKPEPLSEKRDVTDRLVDDPPAVVEVAWVGNFVVYLVLVVLVATAIFAARKGATWHRLS